jgi:exodeoxyribonuclease V alpha subunit
MMPVKKEKITGPKQGEVSLSTEQESAVILCTDLSVLIASVTGGAGTGKTLVLGEVHKTLRSQKIKVALAAPTGRAAKRIQELTGIPAKTVHRLLQFPMPDEADDGKSVPGEPKRNKRNPFDEQVIIVDEASMIPPTLYRQLIDALPKGGVIRFFGDNNQLPPVEEGDPPFITILKERPKVELTYNYRSDDMVIYNASRILRGLIPVRNPRFEIIYVDHPMQFMAKWVTDAFVDTDHQIIMPTRKGNFGTMKVNPTLQLRFNKFKGGLRCDRYSETEAKLIVKPNDKVIWVKNDYKLHLFNGEIGYVNWINEEDGSLGIDVGSREVTVPPKIMAYSAWHGSVISYDPRKQIELGYAITTHKAQGSEFDTVVYCISRGQAFLLNRRNFYTAVTRAKRNVIVIADRRAMYLALRKADV